MKLRLPFSGYSRGYEVVEVDSDTLEGAMELLKDYQYTVIDTVLIRDDLERVPGDASED